MFNFFRKNGLIILLILGLCNIFLINDNLFVSAEENDVHIVLDTTNITTLPNNFRTTSNLDSLKPLSDINIQGLDTLNISGSQQFSPDNIKLLINSMNTKLPITVIDLRQESHGFINEYPISWKNVKNNANAGLTRKEVINTEIELLNSIPIGAPIQFFNDTKLTVLPKKVLSENQLTKNNSIDYVRIPVTDGKLPNADMVEFFIDYVNSMTMDSWLHFHCKEGIGRTTTFMIMYDIVKNYKDVTLEEIINRQIALSGIKETTLISFPTKERLDFFSKFYQYIQEENGEFKTSWSQWLKKNNYPISSILIDKLDLCA